MRYWQKRLGKASRRARQSVIYRLYRDRNPETKRTMLVAGVARSGTTWVGEIIASQAPSRIMFEPFNPNMVPEYRLFSDYQYTRPEEENESLQQYCHQLFSGQIRNRWVDRQISHLAPQYRVVKAVRANLLLKWLNNHFPEVSQVLVIRHPCAVVLSWTQLGWNADEDIRTLLGQPDLLSDFLLDKQDVTEHAKTDEEKVAIVWCICNLVALTQCSQGEAHIVFYEHLCTQPEIELPKLFTAIKREYSESVFKVLGKPSTTSRSESAVVSGQDKVSGWRGILAAEQVDRVRAIVKMFGLDFLYGDSNYPLVNGDELKQPAFTKSEG